MTHLTASLAMSTSVLKALPGKLDIKRHSSSNLYVQSVTLEFITSAKAKNDNNDIDEEVGEAEEIPSVKEDLDVLERSRRDTSNEIGITGVGLDHSVLDVIRLLNGSENDSPFELNPTHKNEKQYIKQNVQLFEGQPFPCYTAFKQVYETCALKTTTQ